MIEEKFEKMLGERGISLSPKKLEQFAMYFTLLVEWNEKMNLTTITEKEEVYIKHFFDSISPAFYYDFSKPISLCDVGAGAGFPSIPLKICYPHLKLTVVDSLQKRIGFLSYLATQLQLEGVAFYHNRAEIFGQDAGHRESYDIVVARAVARLSVLSELCLPLVKSKGTFIAMKAVTASEELEAAQMAIKVVGGELSRIEKFILPIEESERTIIVIDKKRKTPKKYPRRPGTPNKLPIE